MEVIEFIGGKKDATKGGRKQKKGFGKENMCHESTPQTESLIRKGRERIKRYSIQGKTGKDGLWKRKVESTRKRSVKEKGQRIGMRLRSRTPAHAANGQRLRKGTLYGGNQSVSA